MIIETAIA